ncbi:hypothetical protein BC828DRAFT_375133 [Blastocladiella britannica]|nr:hypothetical protein BC828DRAFT_375133 [Blastocladiella britannica]
MLLTLASTTLVLVLLVTAVFLGRRVYLHFYPQRKLRLPASLRPKPDNVHVNKVRKYITDDNNKMSLPTITLTFPTAPTAAKARAVAAITAPRKLPIDQASPRFHTRADPTDETALAALFGVRAVDVFPAEDTTNSDSADDDAAFLATLDPKEWKAQDHYRVLGLGHLRFLATADDIKQSHRSRVLKHHPDKLAATKGANADDLDAVFKCLQKAYDTLADPAKRRSYDACDRGVSDDIPTDRELRTWFEQSPETFYDEVQTLFEREARFATKPNRVPAFGTDTSGKGVVDKFYAFWYAFGHEHSWRSFEYDDKEDAESASNRDHKRHIESKNKAERQRRKTEDNTRIRVLVDRVLAVDPRPKRFKEQEKAAKKGGRGASASVTTDTPPPAAATAAPTAVTPTRPTTAPVSTPPSTSAADTKAAVKRDKKAIRTLVTKDHGYLQGPGADVTSSQMESVLLGLERLLEGTKGDAHELASLLAELTAGAASAGTPGVRAAFDVALARTARDTADHEAAAAAARAEAAAASAASSGSGSGPRPWSPKELQILVLAVKKIPGGALERWDKVAEYVAVHSGEEKRKVVDVIAQSKALAAGGGGKEQLKVLQDHRISGYDVKDAPTTRYE